MKKTVREISVDASDWMRALIIEPVGFKLISFETKYESVYIYIALSVKYTLLFNFFFFFFIFIFLFAIYRRIRKAR